MPLIDRFMTHVQKTDGCWLWTGWVQDSGYGRFSVSHKRAVQAHRWAYEHFVGPIPEGLTIDHVKDRGCTSRRCVNPAHLEAVPLVVNLRRSPVALSTVNAAKDRCPLGHPYDAVNKKGARFCRRCRAAQQRAYLARRALR
jgi:HNH endonuclease